MWQSEGATALDVGSESLYIFPELKARWLEEGKYLHPAAV